MRLVYYAVGGGLGHRVRAHAFLHSMGFRERATLITASTTALDARLGNAFDPVIVPRDVERDANVFCVWLIETLRRLKPDCVCVDAFPAGILGELGGLPDDLTPHWWHVARLLRWDEYRPLIHAPPPRYERVFRVEALHADHQAFLDDIDAHSEDLELIDALDAMPEFTTNEPYWLVVHSGPRDEVAELLAYADDMRHAENVDVPIWLATLDAPTQLPSTTRVLDASPATRYFAAAQRIISAAGFNVMRQAEAFRDKHFIVPMPRRFDDQFERARRARLRERHSEVITSV